MTELEREFELAERAERRQQEVQRRKLLKQTGKAAQEAAHGPVPAGPTVAGTRSRGETLAGEGVGRSMRSGREEREEAAKKTAMQELVAARKARTEGRCVRGILSSCCRGRRAVMGFQLMVWWRPSFRVQQVEGGENGLLGKL